MSSVIIFHQIKQIVFMLPRICIVIDHRRRQNVVRTSVTDKAMFCVLIFFSNHILTQSVIYHWRDVCHLFVHKPCYIFNYNTYAWKSWRKGEKSVLAKLDNELMLLFSRCLITNKIPMSAQNLKSNLNVAINICLEQEWRLLRTWAWTWCGLESWHCYKKKVHQDHEFTQEWRSGQRQPWTCLNKHKILAKVTAQVQIGSLCWNEI